MPLKVLLADDSAAIKKVVQLSLQDIGLELKTISSGKEAFELAKQFKPDIAFIDVLLPQKSGYDVASEIKKDSSLKNTPIILLWSAFMAFDEEKYKSCGANEKLEKPFDSGTLRSIITKFVPQSKPKDLPNLDFEVPIGTVPPAKKAKTPPAAPKVPEKTPEPAPDWSMSSFEDINSFAGEVTKTQAGGGPVMPDLPEAPQKKTLPTTPEPTSWNNDNEWVRKDLGKFQVPIPKKEEVDEAVPFEYTSSQIVDTSFLFKPKDTGTSTMLKSQKIPDVPVVSLAPEMSTPSVLSESPLSLEQLSDLKVETREIIEKVVWKLVPELANQIIREELDRLLKPEPLSDK